MLSSLKIFYFLCNFIKISIKKCSNKNFFKYKCNIKIFFKEIYIFLLDQNILFNVPKSRIFSIEY